MAKIAHGVSHLDHSLSAAHLALVESTIAPLNGFAIVTIDLPADLPALPCALHGPLTGGAPVPESDVTYVVRGTRPGASRMVARPTQDSRKLSMIVGPAGDHGVVLYTAFGGPVSPREPFDPGLAAPGQEAALAESRAFWSEHALSL